MPSPLMRMSLGDGACMAPKNIVLAAGLFGPGRPGALDGAAGGGAAAGAPEMTGMPQAPQKRCPGASGSPQHAHTLGAAAAANGSAALPLGASPAAAAPKVCAF